MTRFVTFTAASVIAGLAVASQGYSQTPAPAPAAPHQDHAPAATGAPAQGHDMMAMHKKMMAEMSSADASLDALVTRMNAATGTARVDALAEVVTALVQQHKAMHAHMAQMHEHMMQMDHTAKPMGGPMMAR